MNRLALLIASCGLTAAVICRPVTAAGPPQPASDRPREVAVSLWLGGITGEPWTAVNAEVPRPTASAIKAFYLVELFSRFATALDQPLPGAEAILNDADHPGFSHFNGRPGLRDTIARELGTASVRRVAEIMIGKTTAGTGDERNLVYNAAANLVTAALGGPEPLTALIRKRGPAFASVSARRYMLRDRKSPGDNEATAASIAALYRRLAQRRLDGIDGPTMDAIRDVLLQKPDDIPGPHLAKSGALRSDPLTQVRAGLRETPAGSYVYVVMLAEPTPEAPDLDAVDRRLAATADRLRQALTRGAAAFLK